MVNIVWASLTMECPGAYLQSPCYNQYSRYRKIPKSSPGAYIFSKAFFEGLIFGGAYIRSDLCTEGNLRFKIDRASLIVGSKFKVFALFYFVFEDNFPITVPQAPKGLIFGGTI